MEISASNNEKEVSLAHRITNALSFWWKECVWPGLGLFGESYLLFSIGTLTPLWELLFQDCLIEYSTCRPSLRHALTYTIVLGVISGMILVGTLSNTLGRRVGSILTASFMCGGAWGMALVSLILVNNASLLFQCMLVLLFLFGVGVGGEYPLSASSASERAMMELQENQQREEEEKIKTVELDYTNMDQQQHLSLSSSSTEKRRPPHHHNHRGRRVQLVFTMQGMGIMFNCIIMTLLLLIMGQTGILSGES